MVGDSIVKRIQKHNDRIEGAGRVIWGGLSGARIPNFAGRAANLARKHGRPTTIIVAVGTNDVFRAPVGTTRHRLIGEVKSIHNLFPQARIIWSDILLREAYKNEKDPGAGKRVTKDLNKNAKEQLQPVPNAHIIKNEHIFYSGCGLYDDGDDTHPNAIGMDVLRQHWARALAFFDRCPSEFQYPTEQEMLVLGH